MSTAPVTVRRADLGDLEDVRGVGHTAWPPTYHHLGAGYVAAGLEQWWSETAVRRSIEDFVTWVALVEATVVGTATLGLSPSEATLWKCYVVPDRHGCGAGAALVSAAADQCHARGVADLRLFVVADNDHAIGFYRHQGFEVTARHPTDDGTDELEMHRTIR